MVDRGGWPEGGRRMASVELLSLRLSRVVLVTR